MLTNKARDGLRAICVPARAGAERLQAHAIAARAHVPEKFLEPIPVDPRRDGRVNSHRSLHGGNAMAIPASPPFFRIPALAVALGLLAQTAHAVDSDEVAELKRRLAAVERRLGLQPSESDASTVTDLDQRLRVIERKLELQAGDAASRAASTPTVLLDNKGLAVKSAGNSGFEVKLRGLMQGDGRFYAGDERNRQNDGFLLRRVEPTLEGSFGPLLGFRLQAQLAGDSTTLNDAYLDLRFDPRASVRVGKFKQPFGLEQLQSSGALAAIERGLPSELIPARDYGVQLQGDAGPLNYAVGVFNGTVDGRDAASGNPDNEFEATGRVFWEPFRNNARALSGLGFGLAASVADTFGAGNNLLPRYRTPGQVQFFGYRGEVAADGLHRRWSPQAYWYHGPFGAQAEYVTSEQEVRVASGASAGRVEHLVHSAWQLTAGWVLTGEDAGYGGVARPDNPFAADGAGWGAFELIARVGELDVDDEAFPLFANPDSAARRARAWSLGLNWYLTRNLKLASTWSQARFDGGAADGADREDEKTLFTRAQLNF